MLKRSCHTLHINFIMKYVVSSHLENEMTSKKELQVLILKVQYDNMLRF